MGTLITTTGKLLDMFKSKLPAHLIGKGNVKACSECGQEFPLKSKPSLGEAFAEHVRKMHARKGDFSKAAVLDRERKLRRFEERP